MVERAREIGVKYSHYILVMMMADVVTETIRIAMMNVMSYKKQFLTS